MSSIDNRIMQFMQRKESQFPELKQSSTKLFRDLVEDNSALVDDDIYPAQSAKKHIVNTSYPRMLVGA